MDATQIIKIKVKSTLRSYRSLERDSDTVTTTKQQQPLKPRIFTSLAIYILKEMHIHSPSAMSLCSSKVKGALF